MLPLQRTVARRATRWWVVWALLWVTALVPALGPVWAQAQLQNLPPGLQVCTATGMVWVQDASAIANADLQDDVPAAAMDMECPWCQSHTGAAPLPAPADAGFVASMRRSTWPPQYDRPAPLAWVWRSAWTRGPPALA